MLRPKTMISTALVLAVVVRAQIDLPVGKDLDPYLFPSVDTLYLLEEGLDSLPAPTSPDFVSKIRKRTEDPTISSVRVDTANRVLHYASRSVGSLKRTDGVVSGTETSYPSPAAGVDYTRWLFDAQGRRVSQIFGTRSGGFEFGSDTISYDWSRSGCPDEFWADTKREWTVDAQGHCSRGTIYAKSGDTWSEVGVVDQLVWDGNKLAAAIELEIDGSTVDTVAKDIYSHDGDGNWAKVDRFSKTGSGVWRLDARSINEWDGGKFAKGLDTEYDRAGNVVWSLQLSTVPPSTSSARNRSLSRGGLEARVVGAEAVFANPQVGEAQVRITDLQGRTVAEFAVPSLGKVSWSGARGGIWLWRASSSEHGAAAGRLVLR
ncbi:MAG TPA: hypothetical protein PK208_14955 [Fibrobacteria bacterium]|nr:hypothetical protein [Fibrobacteria bacterium]